mgnify:CR=1 FL=1
MEREDIKICPVCGKKYRIEPINFPSKMEDGRFWVTYYHCPYCKDEKSIVEVRLPSDQDVEPKEL